MYWKMFKALFKKINHFSSKRRTVYIPLFAGFYSLAWKLRFDWKLYLFYKINQVNLEWAIIRYRNKQSRNHWDNYFYKCQLGNLWQENISFSWKVNALNLGFLNEAKNIPVIQTSSLIKKLGG